jgi:homoserine dehydrogenase
MKNNINIAVVGLGQVGSYLLNELNIKKMILSLKLEKK